MLFSPHSHYTSWSNTESLQYIDHIHDKCRFTRGATSAVSKQLIHKHKYTLHSKGCGDGIRFSLSHSKERLTKKPEGVPSVLRSVSRRSFVHKNYINFDISKVVQVKRCDYDQGNPASIRNEVEIELSGKNEAYDTNTRCIELYADSLIMKLMDIVKHVTGEPAECFTCTSE